MFRRLLMSFTVLSLAMGLLSCTSYTVQSKSYITDFNHAQPRPGKFRYVKRNLMATAFWDSEKSPEEKGSAAYVVRMTSLVVEATKQLTAQANLGPNQSLYNVRISAPGVTDQYFAYFIFGAAFWFESRYAVTISADVIEFI